MPDESVDKALQVKPFPLLIQPPSVPHNNPFEAMERHPTKLNGLMDHWTTSPLTELSTFDRQILLNPAPISRLDLGIAIPHIFRPTEPVLENFGILPCLILLCPKQMHYFKVTFWNNLVSQMDKWFCYLLLLCLKQMFC